MKRTRWAMSLIETVIALSVASVVFTGGIGVIHMMLRIDRQSRRAIEEIATVSRLSRTFRQDVHAARQMVNVPMEEADEQTTRFQLQLPDGQHVTYEARGNRLARTLQTQTGDHFGDDFVFPNDIQVTIEIRRNPDRALAIVQSTGGATEPAKWVDQDPSSGRLRRMVRIEATLDRDGRLLSAGP